LAKSAFLPTTAHHFLFLSSILWSFIHYFPTTAHYFPATAHQNPALFMVIDSAASHILYNLLIYICFVFFDFVNTLPCFLFVELAVTF
ncbi:hypothetical protein ACP6DW_31615, partial [Klebsiella pneumoniae subsp. pneumoniae]|uniref:hypothetical protein n=1 Tax=Klebsiella pneumoniae TaxID=573 RepID=UPI003CEDBF6A